MRWLPGTIILVVDFFPFSTLNVSCHYLLACRVSAEWSSVNHMMFPLYVTCFFSLADIFVCLFVFPLMDNVDWGGNPFCWWLGFHSCLFFFFFMFKWAVLHSVTGGCVILGLVFKWFPLCEFSLFLLPRVSSLIV